LLFRASAAPGVSSVTVASTTPMLSVPLPSMSTWVAAREGFKPDGRHYWTNSMTVTPDYFQTLSIPLLRGRVFDERDRKDAPNVVIVSEDLARWMWPGQDPIGHHLTRHWPDSAYPPEWREVVGVVRNVHGPLSDGTWSPTLYEPMAQTLGIDAFTIAARGVAPPGELLESLKAAVVATRGDLLPSNPRLMRDGVGEIMYPRRAAAAILGLAGTIGLLLASTGLYGLISYSVAQRVREIGVRLALGAERPDIVRLIIKEGLKVSAAGIGLGFVLSFTAIRLTSRLVIAMPPADLLTFSVVPLLLGAVIIVACYVPALRAARVDPLTVLRGL
jgi:putative ABC transport system permease protein